MKLPALLSAGSFLANAVLVAVLALKPTLAPPAFRDFFARHFHTERATPAPVVPRPASPPRHKLWATLDTGGDYPALIARLRAAGFPPALIREIISREIGARYETRMQALTEPDPNTPFWKLRSGFFGMGDKRLEEYEQLWRERTKVLRDLFNDDFFATDDVTVEQRRKLGNLPRQKIDQLQRIEDDYAEMMSAIRSAMGGVTLPGDLEKLALLARERRADLAAVLTPEELADYELRSSPITNYLRSRLTTFDATEAEFRAIFAAHQALSDKFPGGAQTAMMDDSQQRNTAQKEFNDQLRAGLGDARYADFLRETNNEFKQLNRFVQRESLAPDTATQAFGFRDTVERESNRIYDDATLNAGQKRTALQTLAQNTRTQLNALLGPVAGPAYVKIADQWLGNVENGAAVRFNNSAPMVILFEGGSVIFSSSGGMTYRRIQEPKPGP